MSNFLFAFVVSFLGSIPLGSLNLTAVQLYLKGSIRSVIYFAVPAAVVEFFYSYIAIQGEIFISENKYLDSLFSYVSIAVFFILGIVNWTSQKKEQADYLQRTKNPKFLSNKIYCIKTGFLLSILNPQAIPFWLFLSSFLKKEDIVEFSSLQSILAYNVGVAFGTFLCLIAFAIIIGKLLKQKGIPSDFVTKVIGSIFFGIGIIQSLRLIL